MAVHQEINRRSGKTSSQWATPGITLQEYLLLQVYGIDFMPAFYYALSNNSAKIFFMNERPIFIVDDDFEDQEILEEAWKELEFKNPLRFFKSGEDVIHHLKKDPVVAFVIIS